MLQPSVQECIINVNVFPTARRAGGVGALQESRKKHSKGKNQNQNLCSTQPKFLLVQYSAASRRPKEKPRFEGHHWPVMRPGIRCCSFVSRPIRTGEEPWWLIHLAQYPVSNREQPGAFRKLLTSRPPISKQPFCLLDSTFFHWLKLAQDSEEGTWSTGPQA